MLLTHNQHMAVAGSYTVLIPVNKVYIADRTCFQLSVFQDKDSLAPNKEPRI